MRSDGRAQLPIRLTHASVARGSTANRSAGRSPGLQLSAAQGRVRRRNAFPGQPTEWHLVAPACCLQWRDRAGFSPASLLRPQGHLRMIADMLRTTPMVRNERLAVKSARLAAADRSPSLRREVARDASRPSVEVREAPCDSRIGCGGWHVQPPHPATARVRPRWASTRRPHGLAGRPGMRSYPSGPAPRAR